MYFSEKVSLQRLSDWRLEEVTEEPQLWRTCMQRGKPQSSLEVDMSVGSKPKQIE